MPEIFLPHRNVVLEFPDGMGDSEIKAAIDKEYPMTGEEVAGHMMVNPDWFSNDMTLDEYERYREWKSEQSMGVGDFASAAGGAFKQVGGEVVGALGEMVTSPIQSAKAFPSAVGVGTLDIWNLGKQIVNHFKETDDTYEDFLAGRKDTEARRTEYDKQLEKDMAAERDKIQYFNQIREDLIKESDNPEFTRGASNVLDPTIFFGGFLGKQFAKAASKVAATATGKAASKIGRGMARAGDKLGEIGEGITETGSRAFTGATGVTPETGRALAVGTGIGGGVMTAGAPVVAGAYGATKGLQVGGRVLAEAGEGLQRGIGREGFFGGAAARLEPGSGAQRLAQGLSLTDPLLEYGAGAAGGMVAGGVVGMGLGGLADGWEGAASGLGGGMALGGVGGGIARGVEGVTGAALRAKRAKDFDFAASLLPDDQAAMIKGYAKKYGKDQAAMILDTVNYFRGRLGDIDGRTEAEVRFIDEPNSSKRGFVLSVAESDGKPRITVNLGKERSDLTIGHELWHGLLKMEQIQETGIAEAVRTEIRGMWSEGKLIEEGLIPEAQLESYFNDYVNKLTPDEKKSVIDRHGKNTETKSDYIVDEIAAEYMSQLVTGGTKGRGRYDKMLNAFDTFTREKIDDIVIDGSRNVITKAITRLSDMGITPGSSKLFPDLKKASPVINSLMRKMIRTRKNLDEVVTGLDETFNGKKLTTVIRKKDLKSKQFQDELDSLGLLKDDGKGGKVLKNDKDFAAELEKSEDAVRDILIKGGPDGMRIDTVGEADKQTEIVIGNKFSDEQIQQIKDSATILPHIKQTLADFNSAVDSGSIIDMTYFGATKHITNRLTGKSSPRYSSGIKKSRREVLPYKIAVTKAGNFLVKVINWTQLWTKTATQAASGKLKLWENNHKAFLDDFKLYLDNYVSDKPETSASVFGKAKADYMHSLMEGGGRDSIVKDFRLDRVHGIKETGEKAAMSEIAWRRSQARFMPDEGGSTPVTPKDALGGKSEPGTVLPAITVISPELAARFMPAVNDPGYHTPEGKMAFPMLADRMKVGTYKARSGKEYELRGGPDHPDIVDNKGVVAWAVEGGSIASQLQTAINKTDGIGLVVLQDEAAVSGNKTFSDIMLEELRYDVANNKKAARSINKRIKDAALWVRKWAKAKGKKKWLNFKPQNLDDLAAVAPEMSFELRGEVFRKVASIDYKRKTGGVFWRDVMREVTAYQNKDGYRTGDIVKVIQFDKGESIVDPSEVGTPAHPSYRLAVKGRSIGNIKGRLSAYQVFRDAFDAMEKEKPGRGITPEGKIGKSAFRSMQMRSLTDPIFREDVGGQTLDVKVYDQPLEFAAKSGPERAELAKRSEVNQELGARFMPDVGGQDSLGMFSAAERATVDLKQEKGGASQMLAMIKKAGVKDEEIAELGLDKFLEGNRKVSKDEIVDYLVENQITVEETVLGEALPPLERLPSDYEIGSRERVIDKEEYAQELRERYNLVIDRLSEAHGRLSPEDQKQVEAWDDAFNDWVDYWGQSRIQNEPSGSHTDVMKWANEVLPGAFNESLFRPDVVKEWIVFEGGDRRKVKGRGRSKNEAESDALQKINDLRSRPDAATKHSGYVEPGADEGSYRELLLRLPRKDMGKRLSPGVTRDEVVSAISKGIEAQESYVREGLGDVVDAVMESSDVLKTLEKELPNAEFNEVFRLLIQADNTTDYTGGHYGEYPNVLAHVRFNDRTSEYGKTLFLEEMQSDWHQAGRKKGYQGGETVAEVQKLAHADREKFYSGKGYESDAQWAALSERVKQWDEREAAAKGAVPAAPFKTSWHELSMKRMISYAAKHGYDAIAWTKGETQANRYDLSKQVKEIAVPSVEPNVRAVRIEPIGGTSFKLMVDNGGKVEGLYAAEQFTGKQLDEVIGKEMAEKVMAFESPGKLTGLDLKVGGEGMKGFYDRMLPKMKIWKKLGLKVETGMFKKPTRHKSGMRRLYRDGESNLPAHIVRLSPEVKAKVLDTGIARFMPDASVPGAEKNSIGWSMLMSKAGNWRVYGPDGVLAGVAANKNRAEQIFRTKYKRELRREERLAK